MTISVNKTLQMKVSVKTIVIAIVIRNTASGALGPLLASAGGMGFMVLGFRV